MLKGEYAMSGEILRGKQEIADYLKVCIDTLDVYIRVEDLPVSIVNRRYTAKKDELKNWLDRYKIKK